MTGDSTRRAGTTVGGVGSGWPSDIPRPQPPVWDVFDIEVDLRNTGQVVAQLGIDDRLVAGNGLASAGLVAMLADSILGTDAALRARARIATAVLTMDLVGSPPETGLLRAVSGDSGRRAGYLHTTAAIRDAGDIEVARVTGWFAARGGPPVPSSSVALPSSPAVIPAERGAPRPGAADLPATPLWRTLGLGSFTSGSGGAVAFELPHVGRLSNSGGTLHGGVAALMASVAALATLGDAVRPEVLSMTCHYLRGAGGDGRPVRVTGRQIRRGRTSAVVQGDVLAADGRPAMHTVVTTALHS
jgi:acyl-coenzyme A thioesterase PaaI-like protein